MENIQLVEKLEESRQFWQKSADFDKKQLFGSFTMAAVGVGVAAGGITSIVRKDFALGIAGLVAGVGVAKACLGFGMDELQGYADANGKVAVRQYQIEQIHEEQLLIEG